MERSQHRSNDNLPQKETTVIVWPRVTEGRGGYHQTDVKHRSTGKGKKGGPIRDGWTTSQMT